MTTILQFLIQSVPIFISIVVPGYLIAAALLRKTNLRLFEIVFIGIIIGMSAPAILAFVESLIGISFTPQLVWVNLAITTLIGIILFVKERPNVSVKSVNLRNLSVPILLLVIMLLAFWVRIQALSPYFYDFDPYWYNALTQFIITHGQLPQNDDLAWWPNLNSHKNLAHVQYISAGWYHIYSAFNGMKGFSFESMTMVSGLYPPLVASLLCFFAYLWFSREYNEKLGLIVAALLAFSPEIVHKMLAGSFELAPWGFFTIVFFYAAYYLTLKYESKRFAVLSSMAIGLAVLGAPASIIPNAVLSVLIIVYSLVRFFKNELKIDFIMLNAIVVAGALFAGLLQSVFYWSIVYNFFISTIALIIAFILLQLQPLSKTSEDKFLYLGALAVISLIVLLLTPLRGIVEDYMGTFFYVSSYTNPTFQTIAEQTGAPSDFSYSLGLLGLQISGISITPFLIIFSALSIVISLLSLSLMSLIAIFGVYAVAISGLLKVKYLVYLGMMTPIAFCILIGELSKRIKQYEKFLLALATVVTLLQFAQYYDLFLSSSSIASKIDVTNNTLFFSTVCDKKNQEMQVTYGVLNKSNPDLAKFVATSMQNTYRIYCSRIPDWWLGAVLWIRDNRQVEDRLFSWWDYGHWTTTIGQGKTVTDNIHAYTIMHQEVADKFVSDTPEALAQYMIEHKAKYVLLDMDLIGKWGALVYHSCYYNNLTAMEKGPGGADCDVLYSPEVLFVASQPKTTDLCSLKIEGVPTQRVYSSLSKYYNFKYYCLPAGLNSIQESSNDVMGRVFSAPFYYENGSLAGISGFTVQGTTQDGYYILSARYVSSDPDQKGYYYDSIFYKGFFEGSIPYFTQVYPLVYVNEPKLPVRIYKLLE